MSQETPLFNRYEAAVLERALINKTITPSIALRSIGIIDSMALATNTVKRLENRGYLSLQQGGVYATTSRLDQTIRKKLLSSTAELAQPAFKKPVIKNTKVIAAEKAKLKADADKKREEQKAATAKAKEDENAKLKADADKKREVQKAATAKAKEVENAKLKADADKKREEQKAATAKAKEDENAKLKADADKKREVQKAATAKAKADADKIREEQKAATAKAKEVENAKLKVDAETKAQKVKKTKVKTVKTTFTKAQCIVIASSFSSRTNWNLGCRTSWALAKKNGWYEECCEHLATGETPLKDKSKVTPPVKAQVISAIDNVMLLNAKLTKALSIPIIDNVDAKTSALKEVASMMPDNLATIINDICEDLTQ
tara:strand:+ start:1242 stop:2363 length:1122 start_codon:yes stop_codon:yes gene_type:complete